MPQAKYDVWFCHCGRIQFMENDLYDWLEKDPEHNRVVQVCQNCGATKIVWLTDNGEDGFYVNSSDFTDTEMKPGDGYTYHVIFNHGKQIPLLEGAYADSYFGHRFMNREYVDQTYNISWIPDLEKQHSECLTVDVQQMMRMYTHDELISISGYAVPIDWKGTPYERRY